MEGAITRLANNQYDHLNIKDSIQKVYAFTKIISKLFAILFQLDYIGKRKDAGIFIKEQIVASEPQALPKQRRSFLAE